MMLAMAACAHKALRVGLSRGPFQEAFDHGTGLDIVAFLAPGARGIDGLDGNKGDVLNCRGKMPSLRRGGLPGSFDLPKELRLSLCCSLPRGQGGLEGRSSLSGSWWRAFFHGKPDLRTQDRRVAE